MQELSNSAIGTLKECERKFWYQYELELIPKTENTAMTMGTVAHAGMAAGYIALANGQDWLTAARDAAYRAEYDREARPINLEIDKRANVADMLEYYWEHVGKHDRFRSIIAIEQPLYLRVPRSDGSVDVIRCTLDMLATLEEFGDEPIVFDHKTSSNIDEDQGHLALDQQTHLYYLAVRQTYGTPLAFVHNFVRRFEEKDKVITGPPSFRRASDGEMPYAKTLTGKARTASDDPNDYVRRVRTPLSDTQLNGYYREIQDRLRLLSFCRSTGTYVRRDAKLGFGCKSCPYYALCTTELDGREVDPQMLSMLYDREVPSAPRTNDDCFEPVVELAR